MINVTQGQSLMQAPVGLSCQPLRRACGASHHAGDTAFGCVSGRKAPVPEAERAMSPVLAPSIYDQFIIHHLMFIVFSLTPYSHVNTRYTMSRNVDVFDSHRNAHRVFLERKGAHRFNPFRHIPWDVTKTSDDVEGQPTHHQGK